MQIKEKCKVNTNILLFAVRYSIGRMSYAPLMVSNAIKENIVCFTDNELEIIIDDINSTYNYGMEFDKSTWFDLKEYINTELNNRKKK